MISLFNSNFVSKQRKQFVILFLWCAGLGLGCYIGNNVSVPVLSLVRNSLVGSVSIVRLFVANFLPFVLTAFVVYIGATALIFPLCFLMAFAYGISLMALANAFAGAAWLIFLVLFLPLCFDRMLYLWFLLRNCKWKGSASWCHLVVVLVILVIAIHLDYCIISPFVRKLLN